MGKHATEEQIALCVDALMLKRQTKVPEYILDHVGECFECKMAIVGTFQLMEHVCSDTRLFDRSGTARLRK